MCFFFSWFLARVTVKTAPYNECECQENDSSARLLDKFRTMLKNAHNHSLAPPTHTLYHILGSWLRPVHTYLHAKIYCLLPACSFCSRNLHAESVHVLLWYTLCHPNCHLWAAGSDNVSSIGRAKRKKRMLPRGCSCNCSTWSLRHGKIPAQLDRSGISRMFERCVPQNDVSGKWKKCTQNVATSQDWCGHFAASNNNFNLTCLSQKVISMPVHAYLHIETYYVCNEHK